jgi:hypothetical protein
MNPCMRCGVMAVKPKSTESTENQDAVAGHTTKTKCGIRFKLIKVQQIYIISTSSEMPLELSYITSTFAMRTYRN